VAELLTTLPHDFEFIADNRAGLTFEGDIRLDPVLNNGAGAVQLEADSNGDYPTVGEHYVVTELYTPRAVRQWLAFQVDIVHQFDGPDTQLTGDGYRLSDGTDHYWWNGSAWAVTTADWSTEAEIAANIGTFPVAARQLQVVARLTTTDAGYTPVLSAVHIAWKGKVEAFEDIVYRTLVPVLRSVRSIMDFTIKVPMPGGSSLNVGTALTASGLTADVVDVEAAFNHNLDPDHYTDILSSYNPTTKIATLSTPVPVGQYAFLRLVVKPQVAIVSTSQDYTEVERVPALQVRDIQAVNSQQLSVDVGITNKATGANLVIPAPYRFNLRFTMIALTPGGVDLMRLLRALVKMVEDNPTITSVATGEQYRFWMTDEFDNTTSPQDNNLFTMQAMFEIRDVLSFDQPARSGKAVQSLVFSGMQPTAFSSGFDGGFR
jgi:hypothetical protein